MKAICVDISFDIALVPACWICSIYQRQLYNHLTLISTLITIAYFDQESDKNASLMNLDLDAIIGAKFCTLVLKFKTCTLSLYINSSYVLSKEVLICKLDPVSSFTDLKNFLQYLVKIHKIFHQWVHKTLLFYFSSFRIFHRQKICKIFHVCILNMLSFYDFRVLSINNYNINFYALCFKEQCKKILSITI